MEIYLIRHTTPLIHEGLCYGQTDIPVNASFPAEAEKVRLKCPPKIDRVYSSPLGRCLRLAYFLYPHQPVESIHALKEIHFGDWENQPWDRIQASSLDAWMKDFVHRGVPGGESFFSLFQRSTAWWERTVISSYNTDPVACITHAGVIRSLLCHCTGTSLENAFTAFPVPFGAVYRLRRLPDPGKEKDTWESLLL